MYALPLGPPLKMHFDEPIARGLMMNDTAHDGSHDFGPHSDSSRWKQSSSSVKQISGETRIEIPDYSYFVGGTVTPIHEVVQSSEYSTPEGQPVLSTSRKRKDKQIQSFVRSSARSQKEIKPISLDDEMKMTESEMTNEQQQYIDAIYFWKDVISTKILFSFFGKFLEVYRNNNLQTIPVNEEFIKRLLTPDDIEYSELRSISRQKSRINLEIKFMKGVIDSFADEFVTTYKTQLNYNEFLDMLSNSIHEKLHIIIHDYHPSKVSQEGGVRGKQPVNKVRKTVNEGKKNVKKAVIGKMLPKTKQKKKDKEIEEKIKKKAEEINKLDYRGVQSDFIRFISKSSLYFNDICDRNGKIKSTNDMSNPFLNKQTSILLKLTEVWYDISELLKHNITGTRTKNLDDELYDFTVALTEGNMPQSIRSPIPLNDRLHQNIIEDYGACHLITDKHVSNNAATSLPPTGKSRVLCSTSAILDGMPTCGYRSTSTDGSWERGDMNFQMTNNTETMYYHGQLQLTDNPKKVHLYIAIKTKIGITIESRKENIDLTGGDLKAYVALKNTLKNIINYIITYEPDILDSTNGTIFENLFNSACNQIERVRLSGPPHSDIFHTIWSELLYKGVGDKFQEVNSACKFGGYVSNYQATSSIVRYDHVGNAIRFFVANDRPSGVRFIIMITYGKKQNRDVAGEINSGAFGGYYGMNKQLIVEREGKRPCLSTDHTITKYRFRDIALGDVSRTVQPTRLPPSIFNLATMARSNQSQARSRQQKRARGSSVSKKSPTASRKSPTASKKTPKKQKKGGQSRGRFTRKRRA